MSRKTTNPTKETEVSNVDSSVNTIVDTAVDLLKEYQSFEAKDSRTFEVGRTVPRSEIKALVWPIVQKTRGQMDIAKTKEFVIAKLESAYNALPEGDEKSTYNVGGKPVVMTASEWRALKLAQLSFGRKSSQSSANIYRYVRSIVLEGREKFRSR